jgi:hypothetical protein
VEAALRKALHEAAGELQVSANQSGTGQVAEAELKAALRRALRAHVRYDVVCERRLPLPDWSGTVLGADVAVTGDDEVVVAAIELKWARRADLYDVVWDFLKLASARRSQSAESAFLAVAAADSCWQKGGCSALFEARDWDIRQLLTVELADQWGWVMKDTRARPRRLPATVSTTAVASVPIHLADEEDWALRAVMVEPSGEATFALEDGQPLFEEGEPPTDEDVAAAERRALQERRARS